MVGLADKPMSLRRYQKCRPLSQLIVRCLIEAGSIRLLGTSLFLYGGAVEIPRRSVTVGARDDKTTTTTAATANREEAGEIPPSAAFAMIAPGM